LIDAPPAAVPPPVLAETGVVVPPVPIASAAGGDDLTRIKGVGPKLADQLRALGVTSFAQVAAWDDSEIDRIDAQLGRFQGRIRRDDWPAQARFLANGDTAGYEAKFGRL
jgi:predicted flap endonuclease-1-like 5' DNA nuclease